MNLKIFQNSFSECCLNFQFLFKSHNLFVKTLCDKSFIMKKLS